MQNSNIFSWEIHTLIFPYISTLTGKNALEPKLSNNENISEQQPRKYSVGISFFWVNFICWKLKFNNFNYYVWIDK